MKTEILNIRIEPELAQALARHKEESGVPVGEFVRRAIRLALFADQKVEKR